jgi:mRNA-degrading endonuclease toxin of MazEF toxin-antitoxin module
MAGHDSDPSVLKLVDPDTGRCNDCSMFRHCVLRSSRKLTEENRELDDDGQAQHDLVDAVDRERGADALERLPAEQLDDMWVNQRIAGSR